MFFTARSAVMAVALVGSSAAHAGFIYDTTNTSRTTQAWVGGSIVDSDATMNLGQWYGSAFFSDGASSVLANQGSDFAASQMTFAGGAQTSSSVAIALAGESFATTRFAVTSAGSLNWIATTNSSASGSNMADTSITLINLTTGQYLFVYTGNSNGNGSIALSSQYNYELRISANAMSTSAGSTVATYNAGFEFVAIPGPSALAMLAVGMAAARGRRRTR